MNDQEIPRNLTKLLEKFDVLSEKTRKEIMAIFLSSEEVEVMTGIASLTKEIKEKGVMEETKKMVMFGTQVAISGLSLD